MTTTTEQAKLDQAIQLFQSGRLDESEVLFRQLANGSDVSGQALAGIGLIRIRKGDLDGAHTMFTNALRQGPSADAHYGLGVVAEQRGLKGDALLHYQEAVSLSSHEGAKKRLSTLIENMNKERHRDDNRETTASPPPQPPFPQPSSSSSPSFPVSGMPGGLYGMLVADAASSSPNAGLSRDCTKFIDSLKMERKVRRSAYPLASTTVWIAPVVLVLGILAFKGDPRTPLILALYFLIFVGSIWLAAIARYITFRRKRYTFREGWLISRTGVFFVSEKTYEITHLVNAGVTRGPLDQITGNGRLTLAFEKHGELTLHGLAPIQELYEIRDKLNNLSRMLRSHPNVKGIIA
ncbi:tetratricopeptide repeat protein [Burkholderia stagnalis]|uniref:tetratricopeptide repeat protein n=1 Tax=Burkholderia stagnalis TaxID=1503054 RepID=UPI0009C0491D|nr:tetratricopeptide repeat protein [Burkholderia stagnalis]